MPKSTENPRRRTRVRLLIEIVAGALRWRWCRFEIADHSMRPTLADGDWVLALAHPRRLAVGDVVVCDLPGSRGFRIVKRITAIDPSDGSLWLLGDDPAAGSVDSRSFGSVIPASVFARLVLRYSPLPPTLIH